MSMIAVPTELAEAFREATGVEQRPRQSRASAVRALERRIADLDWRQENELIGREDYAEKRRRLTADLEELKAEPEEPVSLIARREELRTLVDDWNAASVETRHALVASIFESLGMTTSGGWTGQIRPGRLTHVSAAALATAVKLSATGADPGARTRDGHTAPSLLIAHDDGQRLDAYLAA